MRKPSHRYTVKKETLQSYVATITNHCTTMYNNNAQGPSRGDTLARCNFLEGYIDASWIWGLLSDGQRLLAWGLVDELGNNCLKTPINGHRHDHLTARLADCWKETLDQSRILTYDYGNRESWHFLHCTLGFLPRHDLERKGKITLHNYLIGFLRGVCNLELMKEERAREIISVLEKIQKAKKLSVADVYRALDEYFDYSIQTVPPERLLECLEQIGKDI